MHFNAPRRKLLLVLITSQTKSLQTWLAVLCSVVTVAAIARVGVAAALSLSSAVFAASVQAYSSSQTGCFESLLKMHTGPSILSSQNTSQKGRPYKHKYKCSLEKGSGVVASSYQMDGSAHPCRRLLIAPHPQSAFPRTTFQVVKKPACAFSH